jgi:hypothetical protein
VTPRLAAVAIPATAHALWATWKRLISRIFRLKSSHAWCAATPWARLFADSLLRLEERMLALGARDDDLAETQRLLRDSTITFRAPSTTIAWGRRPN